MLGIRGSHRAFEAAKRRGERTRVAARGTGKRQTRKKEGGAKKRRNEAAQDVTEEKRYEAERFPPSETRTERRSERGVGTRHFGIMQVLVGRIVASYRRLSFPIRYPPTRPRVSRRFFFFLFAFFPIFSLPLSLYLSFGRYQGKDKERTYTGSTVVVHYR